MNEQDFKHALRQTMTVQPAPPPMSDAVVLEAAHRDVKRRRAMMAGLGSAGAVAAVIVGVAVIAPAATGSGSGGVGVGGQVTSTSASDSVSQTAPPPASGSATESDGKSTVNRPPGMTDDTARSGPEFDRGQALANEVDAVLPTGFAAPADLKGEGSDSPLKYSQATLDGKSNGVQGWRYMAITPVTKGTGAGELVVEVTTPKAETNNVAVCDLPAFWGEKGTCNEVTVGGKKVAVVNDTERFDQWAAYRHDDGTVVYIAQNAEVRDSGLPALAGPVFTTEQLAALAANPRFNLDN